MSINSYCRLCEGYCGLRAELKDGRLAGLSGDPADPISQGFICDVAEASVGALGSGDRLRSPLKRTPSGLVPATWDEAVADITQRLKAIRKQSGVRSIGLFLGDEVQRSSHLLARSLGFAVGLGTPNVFSTLHQGHGPQARMAELFIGHPTHLLTDLGRAHYVLHLGADPQLASWGAGTLGQGHKTWVEFSRRTKGTKVVVADATKTGFAETMDQHLPIRPGTEPYLLMGVLSTIVKGGWHDHQYVRDYTTGFDVLTRLTAPWTVERAAKVCGIDAASLSGVALKFARSAMSVANLGEGALANPAAAVGAWAWMGLHTVTANTLRPGGLYEHAGVLDPHHLQALAPTADAPTTRVARHALYMLQAPATALADEVLTPGEGQVRALVSLGGDPVRALPGSARVQQALDALDLHVVFARERGPATAHADWVLPALHPWERADTTLLDAPLLPHHMLAHAPALSPIPDGVRDEESVLAELFAEIKPGLRGSAFGRHVGVLGRLLATADLDSWTAKAIDWAVQDQAGALNNAPHRLDKGAADRAVWRVSHEDERLHLVPPEVSELVALLDAPTAEAGLPLWLQTSRRRSRSPDGLHGPSEHPGVGLHPSHGFADGAQVRVHTRHGSVQAQVRLDPGLREDAVDLPPGADLGVGALLPHEGADPLTGMAVRDGLSCRVEAS